MKRTIKEAVFELLLALPETEEVRTHGTPTFKVGGKTFAYWALDHHGDGRVALWLGSPPGVQQDLVALDSGNYFIPPYVGVKGWLGVNLNRTLPWTEIQARVLEAWSHRAPAALQDKRPALGHIAPPNAPMRPEDINPLLAPAAQEFMQGLAARCHRLPETTPEDERGSLLWRAGKKVFVRGHIDEGRLKVLFRVGAEQQALLLDDPRYSLPMYYHSSGWLALDVTDQVHWPEIEGLLEASYRHFALKRMLKALDADLPW